MREFIDTNYRYGEIKLWCDSREEEKQSVGILVEAKSDELFFRKFFLKKTTFFSMDGYEYLLETIEEINRNNDKGLIGIIDGNWDLTVQLKK